jgi:hypothetical protein
VFGQYFCAKPGSIPDFGTGTKQYPVLTRIRRHPVYFAIRHRSLLNLFDWRPLQLVGLSVMLRHWAAVESNLRIFEVRKFDGNPMLRFVDSNERLFCYPNHKATEIFGELQVPEILLELFAAHFV